MIELLSYEIVLSIELGSRKKRLLAHKVYTYTTLILISSIPHTEIDISNSNHTQNVKPLRQVGHSYACEIVLLLYLELLLPLLPLDEPLPHPPQPSAFHEPQSPLEDPLPLFPLLPEPLPLLPLLPLEEEPHEAEEQGFPQSPLEFEDPPLLPDFPSSRRPLFPLLPEEDPLEPQSSDELDEPQSPEPEPLPLLPDLPLPEPLLPDLPEDELEPQLPQSEELDEQGFPQSPEDPPLLPDLPPDPLLPDLPDEEEL